MKRPGRVLIVDDLENWREVLAEILTSAGYKVEVASTSEEALHALSVDFYHLVSLDIRLCDLDDSNTEGMSLLKTLVELDLLTATEVIMNSAYGTKQQMRTVFRDYGVADFLIKSDFNGRKFLDVVNEVFVKLVRANLALEVEWQDIRGPEQAILGLPVKDKRAKADTDAALQRRIADELEDLLCRLFLEANSIRVRPLAPGVSGTSALWVQPFYESRAGPPVVVKFGDYRKINEEYRNYRTYVEPFIGGGRRTDALNLRRTPLLGGIVYSLIGTSSEQVESLGEYYRHADASQITSSLDHLILGTMSPWHANLGPLESQELGTVYEQSLGLRSDILSDVVRRSLPEVEFGKKLRFDHPTNARTFRNPLDVVEGRQFFHRTFTSITHGKLTKDNVLIDMDGHAFLIDFAKTGPGHVLHDIAALDSLVRLQLLEPDEASLNDRLALEEVLCETMRFSQLEERDLALVTENAAVAKACSVVIHLRKLARRLISQNPSDDIGELYVALLYHALNTVRLPHLPTVQREHALLSASLLLEAIDRAYQLRVEQLELELSEIDQLSKKRFEYLSTASHELGRPLAKIKALLEDILDLEYGFLNSNQREALSSALSNVNHEIELIGRMLDLTRLEAGKVRIDPVACNVVDCLREAINESLEELQKKRIILHQDLPSPGIEIVADPLYIRQAFSNVLHNAVKFTEQGEVGVLCRRDGHAVVVEIRDTGSGIDPDALPHIFEPYFQADRSPARKHSGLGAGLYLVKSWIQLHGGSVHVDSVVNQGTTFSIYVPIHTYRGSSEYGEIDG